eukprot:272246_1
MSQPNFSEYVAHSPARGGGFLSQPAESQNIIFDGNSITPVTIRQLAKATKSPQSSSVILDGHELHLITFVAQISSFEERSTHTVFTFFDGTAGLTAKQWGGGEGDVHAADYALNSYVRIYAEIRCSQADAEVHVIHVNVIEDFNELTFHFLQAIHVHKMRTKAQNGGHEPSSSSGVNRPVPADATQKAILDVLSNVPDSA